MIDDALKSGRINKDTVLIEPTSGNTGIALAFVAAARGLKLILTMPETMTTERKKILKVLGARLVLTEGAKGMKGAIAKAEELAAKIPNSVILQQFSNPSNPAVHRRTTAEEIWKDTDGKVDIVVSGIGTGGTITGIGEVIKPRKPSFKLIAVEPAGSPILSGGQPGPPQAPGPRRRLRPGHPQHQDLRRGDHGEGGRRRAGQQAGRQARRHPVGISSGAAVWAAIQVAKRPENKGKQIVVDHPVVRRALPLVLALRRPERRERLHRRPPAPGQGLIHPCGPARSRAGPGAAPISCAREGASATRAG
jgi:cysteine synthase A